MKELSSNTDKKFLKILAKAKEEKFNEIIILEEEGIYFGKFQNKEYVKKKYDCKSAVDKNFIEKIYKSLFGNEKLINRKVETFYDQQLFFRFFLIFNRNKINIIIKLLDNSFFDIKKYFANPVPEEYKSPDNLNNLFKELLNPNKSGVYVVATQTVNLRKNFLYSLVEELNNKIKKPYKIIIYEEIMEKIFKNKNSFIFQTEDCFEMEKDDRFINADLVLVEKIFDENILLKALNVANRNCKVFLTTNDPSFNSFIKKCKAILTKYDIPWEFFVKNFKIFVSFDVNNGNIYLTNAIKYKKE